MLRGKAGEEKKKTFGRGWNSLGWVIAGAGTKQGQKQGMMISFLWVLLPTLGLSDDMLTNTFLPLPRPMEQI